MATSFPKMCRVNAVFVTAVSMHLFLLFEESLGVYSPGIRGYTQNEASTAAPSALPPGKIMYFLMGQASTWLLLSHHGKHSATVRKVFINGIWNILHFLQLAFWASFFPQQWILICVVWNGKKLICRFKWKAMAIVRRKCLHSMATLWLSFILSRCCTVTLFQREK